VLPVYESGRLQEELKELEELNSNFWTGHGSCHTHSYCYRGGSCCPALA